MTGRMVSKGQEIFRKQNPARHASLLPDLPDEDDKYVRSSMKMSRKKTAAPNQDHIIVFDGFCNICCGFLRFVHANDPAWYFRFTWLQSDLNHLPQKPEVNIDEDEETIILIENGIYYYRSTAFLKIVRHLRFPWPALIVGYMIPVILRDWLYDLVARNRFRLFGKRDQCMVPDRTLRDRFIEFGSF